MDISIITGPLIGAAIGYVTNYIAVKMLFRPLHPIKIGKHTLLFTPGIIPKEKPRLAKAIGDIIGQKLVSHEVLEKALLSDNMKASLSESIQTKIANINEEFTIADMAASFSPDIQLDSIMEDITDKLSGHIKETLLKSDIGSVLSDEIIKSIKNHLQGSFLALMLNDSLLGTIGEYIASGVTEYISNHGEDLLYPYIKSELDTISDTTITSLVAALNSHNIYIENIVMSGYEKLITNDLDNFLRRLDIAVLVEQEINEMDVLELEKLLLTVMKKELNAIVNLGALIGLILGLINLLF